MHILLEVEISFEYILHIDILPRALDLRWSFGLVWFGQSVPALAALHCSHEVTAFGSLYTKLHLWMLTSQFSKHMFPTNN